MVRLGDGGCCPMLNLMRLLWCPTSEGSGGPVAPREYNQSTCDTKEFVPRSSGYFPHDMTKRSLFVVWSDPVTIHPHSNPLTHTPTDQDRIWRLHCFLHVTSGEVNPTSPARM